MNKDYIEKSTKLAQLYDYYKNLLTEKQCLYFELYFFEDLTLQEIADEFNISKNAIYDSINKTSSYLLDLEDKLQLFYKSNKIKDILDKLKKQTNNNSLIEEVEKLL